MGLEQLKKLDFFLKKRDKTIKIISKILLSFPDFKIIGLDRLKNNLKNKKYRNHSWMNLPILYKKV